MPRYAAPNGLEITGTLEILKGRANVIGLSETGEPEYEGGTEIWWDEQRTATRNGSLVYMDEEGNEWTFADLSLYEETEN